MFQEGDIVEIPLPNGRTALGWILHLSRHFKGAVGFVVFGIKGQLREDVVFDVSKDAVPMMDVLGPIYTHVDAIKHYGWRVVSHQAVSESKRMLTKRRVGGDVYVGDDYLGSAQDSSESELKPMLAIGMPIVYKEIERAFGNATVVSKRPHES